MHVVYHRQDYVIPISGCKKFCFFASKENVGNHSWNGKTFKEMDNILNSNKRYIEYKKK